MGFRLISPKRLRKVKTRNGQEVLRRLEEYLQSAAVTGEPVKILCGFWKDQQDAITYQELRQAVAEGAISQETLELWSQDYSILVADRLRSMWTTSILAGAAGQPIFDGRSFEFNTQAPGIMNWIQSRGAGFVTACTQEQKDAIAALLEKKMRDGHTVDELSRLIRPCIGLTERDAKAAARFYDNIVENLKKEHPRMKPESVRKKALDATQKYAERKHRARAMTIAQTECAFAYNRGADEGVRQAQAQGLLGPVMKRWSTSGDDQVCSICQGLEGVELGMDDGFEFKGRQLFAGQNLLPPAHPRCACAVEYIEVENPQIIAETSNMNTYQDEMEDQQLFEELDYRRYRYKESEGIYETWNIGSKDVIKPRNIMKNMNKSAVGREMLEHLIKSNISVKLLYGVDNPEDVYGFYDPIDDDIRIFVDKTITVDKTAEVIIHEAAHRKYNIGDDQWSEAVCIAQEIKHRNQRNTLTAEEKRNIIKSVKEMYPEFPWRK